jgi:branched-chain amino acid aminotransferase
LHYGNAVFDGLRAYHSQSHGTYLFKPELHFSRLLSGAEQMGAKVPYSVDQLINFSYQVLESNHLVEAYVRPLIYFGPNMDVNAPRETNVLIAAWRWDNYLSPDPLKVCFSSIRRPAPQASVIEAKFAGYYINSIMAGTEAENKGFDAALLKDVYGYVVEGSASNLFIEKDGKLFTPPKGSILPGITRQTVIDICKELDITVTTQNLTEEQVLGADSAFFTGTASEITGIGQVEDKVLPIAWKDSIGKKIMTAYRKATREMSLPDLSII